MPYTINLSSQFSRKLYSITLLLHNSPFVIAFSLKHCFEIKKHNRCLLTSCATNLFAISAMCLRNKRQKTTIFRARDLDVIKIKTSRNYCRGFTAKKPRKFIARIFASSFQRLMVTGCHQPFASRLFQFLHNVPEYFTLYITLKHFIIEKINNTMIIF